MNIKNHLRTCLLILMLCSNQYVNANGLPAINIINDFTEISSLSDEFKLTIKQQRQMKIILLDYMPEMAIILNKMMNNRIKLINSSRSPNLPNEGLITTIANTQGHLFSEIIILKEFMKRDLLLILKDEQKDFIRDLFEAIIHFHLDQN